jgi:hypothetical protein
MLVNPAYRAEFMKESPPSPPPITAIRFSLNAMMKFTFYIGDEECIDLDVAWRDIDTFEVIWLHFEADLTACASILMTFPAM